MILAIFLYSISLAAQLAAVICSLRLFIRAKAYQLGCGLIAMACVLMLGRRISPLFHAINDSYINLLDAFLAASISCLLFFGLLAFRKILVDLEYKNTALDLLNKTDFLTGAMSKSEALVRTQLEIDRSFRLRKKLAFLMIDIDHFKDINDVFGHVMGDIVLTNLVKRCQEELRAIDIFSRVGGEEFLVVLPDTNEAQAKEVAERLRKHVEASSMGEALEEDIFITISIGVSIFDPSKSIDLSTSAVMKLHYSACDKAMYRAKATGRNKVSL